jgi:cell division protein FtsZ
MKDAGSALMGIGRAAGENRALEAARQAVASPLLEINISGAQGILFNITGSSNLTLWEVTEAAEEIRAAADPEANIIFGTSFNERLGDEVMITVIATGFDGRRRSDARTSTTERDRVGSSVRGAPVAASAPTPTRSYIDTLEDERRSAPSDDVPSVRGLDGAASAPAPAPRATTQAAPPPRKAGDYDADNLEIPSFLRRK